VPCLVFAYYIHEGSIMLWVDEMNRDNLINEFTIVNCTTLSH